METSTPRLEAEKVGKWRYMQSVSSLDNEERLRKIGFMQEPTHGQSKKQEGLKVSETQGRLPGRRQKWSLLFITQCCPGYCCGPSACLLACVCHVCVCVCVHIYDACIIFNIRKCNKRLKLHYLCYVQCKCTHIYIS